MLQNSTTSPKTSQSNNQTSDEHAALGNNTKLCVTDIKSDDVLVNRYELQKFAQELLPNERVSKCMNCRINAHRGIEIWYDASHEKAHFGNLITCGSVWACPVCAAKITERRRKELQQAIDNNSANGGTLAMFTFTVSHSKSESWETVLNDITQSHRQFWGNTTGRNLKANFGILGTVRGLEATYGDNGPHVHFHTLVFFEKKLSTSDLTTINRASQVEWLAVCARNGRYASLKNGFRMSVNLADINNYVAKNGMDDDFWTLAHETAKSVVKTAKNGGRTPNRLLFDYARGDKEAGKIWVDFTHAFKGKNQLKWSKGLRALLGVSETDKTDEEIATERTENSYLMATIEKDAWIAIVKQDLRAELLNVASIGSQWQLNEFLSSLGIWGAFPVNEVFMGLPDEIRLGYG